MSSTNVESLPTSHIVANDTSFLPFLHLKSCRHLPRHHKFGSWCLLFLFPNPRFSLASRHRCIMSLNHCIISMNRCSLCATLPSKTLPPSFLSSFNLKLILGYVNFQSNESDAKGLGLRPLCSSGTI